MYSLCVPRVKLNYDIYFNFNVYKKHVVEGFGFWVPNINNWFSFIFMGLFKRITLNVAYT